MSARPSDVVRAVLAGVLGTGGSDALGDLDEDFHERVRPTRPGWRAEVWYVREGLSLLGAAVGERLRSGTGRRTRRAVNSGGGAGMMWSRVWRDATRAVVRTPGTSFVIAVTLMVALGATTVMFSLAHAAYLKPFPYPSADRVFHLYSGSQRDPDAIMAVAPVDLADLAAFDGVVEEAAGWSIGESVHMTTGDEPQRLAAPRVSEGFFDLLGAQPVAGRYFVAEEFVPGRDDAVVISEGLWERAFGRDPGLVGGTVELDGRTVRVVGVAPAEGVVPREAEAWRPLALGPEWYGDERWGWQFLFGMVRLTPEAVAGQPSETLNRRLAEVAPHRFEGNAQRRVIRSLEAERSRTSGPAILLLLGAMLSVLALACVNIVTVTMARAEGRVTEYGLRRALGSGAAPLASTALVEALILALVGGAGGLVLAHALIAFVDRVDLEVLRGLGALRIDPAVVAFAGGITVLTALVMAVAPVVLAVRTDPRPALAASDRRTAGSAGAGPLRDGLVALQVALATALMVSVGGSVSSLRTLAEQDPGFVPTGVLSMTVELPQDLASDELAPGVVRRLVEGVEAIPGVQGASVANFLPLQGVGWSASFDLVDAAPQVADLEPHANMRAVGPGYFEVMQIALEDGRGLLASDGPDAPPVVVVDRAVADRYWPGRSPVGAFVQVGGLSGEPAQVVGVVGDVPDQRLGEVGEGHVYFPVLQSPQRRLAVIARTSGEPAGFGSALRAAVRQAEPRMPVVDVETMEQRVADSYAGFRIGVLLLVAFGIVAATLAGLGVYGVVAYSVGRREPELAMRMALGATPDRVFRSVIGHSLRLWALGAGAGIALSYMMRGRISGFVESIEVGSIVWMIAAVVGLGLVALVATALPAGRAVRVDPASSLRR